MAATDDFIKSLRIEENVFELTEDADLQYLVHYAAPYTGADQCRVAKGTAFAPHGPMRGDALYMHLVDDDNDELLDQMKEQVRIKKEFLFSRLQGFSFYITEEQLKTLPLKFRHGSLERVLEIIQILRS